MDIVCDDQMNVWVLCQTVLLWYHLYELFPDEEGVNFETEELPCFLFASAPEVLQGTSPRRQVPPSPGPWSGT